MNNHVYCQNWHQLSNSEILELFDKLPKSTIMPNLHIVNSLKKIKSAKLELLETRSFSSVYRIYQTDEVFQIFQPDGDTYFYDTESYTMQKEVDSIILSYYNKKPVFTIIDKFDYSVKIKHNKKPKFFAFFINNELDKIDWIDEPPLDVKFLAQLMQKLGAFYSNYLT